MWRFPYITGQYGGGFFVLVYVLFLAILGIPIMTMEYAMGRATKRSILPAYRLLEPKGSHWHLMGYLSMAGNYVPVSYTHLEEIRSALIYPYSNGFTEGCNNKIKVLKRVSFGLRNFERFRNRILYINTRNEKDVYKRQQ